MCSQVREKESQMNVKTFFEAEQKQSFWSFITEQQNIRMISTCLSFPMSLCVHMYVHMPTQTRMGEFTHTFL